MNTEETTIKPGAQFKYLGGIFTIGAMYDNIDTFYFKDYQENIYEGRISTLKRMVRDGQYQMVKAHGLGVPQGSPEDRSEAKPECGPADRQPPENELITLERLEKEPGWEIIGLDWETATPRKFRNGNLFAEFLTNGHLILHTGGGTLKGTKTMQDIRTLDKLVNG